MDRRQLLHLLLLSPALCLADNALPAKSNNNDNTLGGVLKPYMQIGDFADDKYRVFMFLSFNCPYCKEIWKGMGDWGKTLPNPFKFVYVPLSFGDKRLDLASNAFYVVRDLAPQKLESILEIAFTKAGNIRSWQEWVEILQRLGLPKQSIHTALNKPATSKRIERGRLLAKRYRLNVTPHFGICGKYATNAGYTNGDYQLLVKLLNALVSEIIQS